MRNFTDSKTYRPRNAPMLDGLPEQVHYADTGCEVSGTCLTCTLPQCKFDNPTWYRSYRRAGRDLELQEAHDSEKLSVFQVAQRFHISPRTVHRALRRAQEPLLALVATAS
jgi:AraC-like DNA-binding protein